MQERQILFRIALTRALYDQMAPQLCPFYVPGKLRSFSSLVFETLAPFWSGKHWSEERKIPICPIHIVFLLGPTQTSFSFPPAGTPEATSWEQEQMARPQIEPTNQWGKHHGIRFRKRGNKSQKIMENHDSFEGFRYKRLGPKC